MKKLFVFGLFILVMGISLTGCGKDAILKSEYTLGEVASIDDLTIKLEQAKYTEDKKLELVFDITNNRDNTLTLSPDDNFVLYERVEVDTRSNEER